MQFVTDLVWYLAALWLVLQLVGLALNLWRLAFNPRAISDAMRSRYSKLGPAGTAFEVVCSIGLLALILGLTGNGTVSPTHVLWMVPAYVSIGMRGIMKSAEWLGSRRPSPPPMRSPAAPAPAAMPAQVFVAPAVAVSTAAVKQVSAPHAAPPVQPAQGNNRIQGTLICDGNAILMRDGMYRAAVGWTNRPEKPLPASSECVWVDVVVATKGADPNPRVAAILTYGLNDRHQRGDTNPTLTARQKELVSQYISAEIPPYMLKLGGQAVVDAFLGAAATAPRDRPRKKSRPQEPAERSIHFTCRSCGRSGAATTGGILLRATLGVWCRDCGSMLCTECQKASVAGAAAAAGLAGTFIEHLGKQYAYEDWYGQECQACSTAFAMELVHSS